MCMDLQNFIKYYVRDEKMWISALGQSNSHNQVKEGNFCELLGFDKQFKDLRECSCEYMSVLEAGAGLGK
jgi:hypothetical protein